MQTPSAHTKPMQRRPAGSRQNDIPAHAYYQNNYDSTTNRRAPSRSKDTVRERNGGRRCGIGAGSMTSDAQLIDRLLRLSWFLGSVTKVRGASPAANSAQVTQPRVATTVVLAVRVMDRSSGVGFGDRLTDLRLRNGRRMNEVGYGDGTAMTIRRITVTEGLSVPSFC